MRRCSSSDPIRPLQVCLLAGLLVFGLTAARPAFARKDASLQTASLCYRAAKDAARTTGVPLQILLALTLTETGRAADGGLQPWPWALNQAGDSTWFATQDEALAALTEAVAAGVTNIDVGCFQLNQFWHGAKFASLEDMLDPKANALYAARLVARHAAKQGDWIAAVGAYHSATPDKAAAYLARFEPIYAALGAKPLPPAPAATDQADRINGFPLLLAGAAASAGSLVPLRPASRVLIGGP